MTKNWDTIIYEPRGDVALIRLNRPEALNALNLKLTEELCALIGEFEADPAISCSVITGSEKAFASGADISEMQGRDYSDMYRENYFAAWEERFSTARKPIIAAVAGYALGGGCELAMMCDFIIAADNAKFGQPEIKLGVMPGMGGSQRLTRFVGKSKSMDMCLTGRMMDAAEAERSGLVSRVVPLEDLIETALEAASTIAGYSLPATMRVKEAVNRSYQTTLAEGILFERRVFHSSFATEDQAEGMAAFLEKRKPDFKNR
jgi:enoyl-CoA hydratase